jgi:hypothetical protein
MLHKYFSNLTFLFGIFLFTVSGSNAQVINPRINSLDIGAKYRAIVKKFGRPISDRRGGEVPCGGAMRSLRYNGLILSLEVGDANPLGLYKVEVTSPKWTVSGLRIGVSRREVISKFGRGPYFIKDGYARFHYKRNKLIKMEWEFNFC